MICYLQKPNAPIFHLLVFIVKDNRSQKKKLMAPVYQYTLFKSFTGAGAEVGPLPLSCFDPAGRYHPVLR